VSKGSTERCGLVSGAPPEIEQRTRAPLFAAFIAPASDADCRRLTKRPHANAAASYQGRSLSAIPQKMSLRETSFSRALASNRRRMGREMGNSGAPHAISRI
jgi:hypothetical protein